MPPGRALTKGRDDHAGDTIMVANPLKRLAAGHAQVGDFTGDIAIEFEGIRPFEAAAAASP